MKCNRSKIMKAAWALYADEHRGMTFDRKFFASCLRRAWKKERRNVERVRAILAGEKVTKCCSVPLFCGDVTVDFGGCLGPAYVSGNTFPHKDFMLQRAFVNQTWFRKVLEKISTACRTVGKVALSLMTL